MGQKNDQFLKKLLGTFRLEAEEHLQEMSARLLELEKASAGEKQAGLIETVFREAHSLKGAARAVNLPEIETLCQSLESVLAALKRKEVALSAALFDALHLAVDTLGNLLASAPAGPASSEKSRASAVIQGLESAVQGVPPALQQAGSESRGEAPASYRPPAEEKPALPETVRISRVKLDSLFLEAQELLSARLAARQRAVESHEICAALAAWEKERAKIRSDVRAIQQSLEKDGGGNDRSQLRERQAKPKQHVTKLLGFLEWNERSIKSLINHLQTLAKSADQDHRALGRMLADLLEDMKKLLMLPFASLLEVFPKIVRDLSRDRGKDAELVIRGGEIEADRLILEEMKDPLVHLIRNCIDHGIEDRRERERKKKLPRGTITIAISRKTGQKVEILVSDDGAGIDTARVRAAAVKLGIASAEKADKLNGREALGLVFHSGVSTSPIITDISGRGLGLAIVREKVEKLGGAIALETDPGLGTTFRIVLPLTLTTFRGVLVRVEGQLFVLPTIHVERVLRVRKDEIKTVENRETIPVDGQAVSLVRLADALELPRKSAPGDSGNTEQAVLLASAEKRIAFLVDEILEELEVLMKTLGKQLARVRNVAGATILGTGKVAPILNVPDLVKSAARAASAPAPAAVARPEEAAKGKSILIAEDSITARTLLKNILESAGHQVTTAVDGVDAWTTLRTGPFDLVVSDVDMPRMNGFDLTAKIRADKKLSELPVVLVTALESREDRERGIDVGANAYIVKRSFDQSDLLGVIRRLI